MPHLVFLITVVKYEKPPINLHQKSGRSVWRDLFESMDVGNWFELPKRDRYRVAQAANKYLRGRYSLYHHPVKPETYVFLKNK